MTRSIAMLTLALTAALSADQAFSAQANAVPVLALSQTAESALEEIGGMLHLSFTATDDFWLIMDIAEDPQAAYETLVDMGMPAPLAEDMVLEAIAIPAFIRYQIKADNTDQTPE